MQTVDSLITRCKIYNKMVSMLESKSVRDIFGHHNLVPRACDPWEGTEGSGIIRCRKPGILAKIELHIPFQRPIRFLPETDYPRASRSFPRIAGSGNEIVGTTGKVCQKSY
jgi:hypothetical protein